MSSVNNGEPRISAFFLCLACKCKYWIVDAHTRTRKGPSTTNARQWQPFHSHPCRKALSSGLLTMAGVSLFSETFNETIRLQRLRKSSLQNMVTAALDKHIKSIQWHIIRPSLPLSFPLCHRHRCTCTSHPLWLLQQMFRFYFFPCTKFGNRFKQNGQRGQNGWQKAIHIWSDCCICKQVEIKRPLASTMEFDELWERKLDKGCFVWSTRE